MNKLMSKGSSKRTKTAPKLDEHVEQSGIDNVDKFIDPTTNVIYHKVKTLGKGGFAKGNFKYQLTYLTVRFIYWTTNHLIKLYIKRR